jgi:hypothetical protein
MIAETFTAEQTRRLLWSHAAHQVVALLSASSRCDGVPIGYGWGLRRKSNGQRAIVVHPSSNVEHVGELALTVQGFGTRVIPRRGVGYVAYLHLVADAVESILHT